MRVLVVSPTPTHPQDEDDRVRAHALLRRLKDFGHVVDLMLVPGRALDGDALRAMRAAWDRVVIVPQVPAATVGGHAGDGLPPALGPALLALLAGQVHDVVIVRHLHLSRALEMVPDGPLKVLQTAPFANPAGHGPVGGGSGWTETMRALPRADLILAPDEDERALLQRLTDRPVIILGVTGRPRSAPERDGHRIGLLSDGDGRDARDVSRFVAESDLGHLAACGGVLRVGGAVAGRLGGARAGLELVLGGTLDLDDLDLLVCPAETGPEPVTTAVTALALGLPVIGTAAALRRLPARAPCHALPGAADVAAFVRRWLASGDMRRELAADSAALAARHAAEVERQHAPFRDPPSLRALQRRPRALAVTHAGGERLANVVGAAEIAMDVDLLVLGASTEAAVPIPAPSGRGRVLRPQGPAMPGTAAALAATRAALATARYDALLLDGAGLSSLRVAAPDGALTVLDAEPSAPDETPSLSQCGWLAEFSFLLTRNPGQHRTTRAALSDRAWYWPSPGADRPCPDRARPVRRAVVTADTPAEVTSLLWFLDQVWPALSSEGLECAVTGDAVSALSRSLPDGVVLAGSDDASGTADIALNLVTGADTAPITREYLLHGLPCVLSEAAADAIGEGEGEAFLVARSRAECVAHVQRLVHDPDWRRAIGEAAFRLGRARFGRSLATMAARGLADLAASRAA